MERNSERGLLLSRAIRLSKTILLCVGAFSSVTLLKVALVQHISDLPRVLLSFRSFASPFYIYIALHFIIAAIVVSSSNSHRRTTAAATSATVLEKTASWDRFHVIQETTPFEGEKEPSRSDGDADVAELESDGGDEASEESSMDDTWRAIMESKRKLGRSETVGVGPRRLERDDVEVCGVHREKEKEKEMRKLATFNDRVSLRREREREELNMRAEAFIKKVNDDMRLQRLESDQRFRDMVNRGL